MAMTHSEAIAKAEQLGAKACEFDGHKDYCPFGPDCDFEYYEAWHRGWKRKYDELTEE